MKKILKNCVRKHWPILVLLVLAALTHFLFLNYPKEAVFDEVHFGKFVSAYFTHQYYFDIHPPLGKLIIAGFANIFGFRPEFSFANIGEKINGGSIFILRFMPALFGVLLVAIIYQLILAVGLSRKYAFLGGWLVLFDNALLVQSKFVLVDIFLLAFGFTGLYLFILSKKVKPTKKSLIFFILAAFSSALAFSVKWTALSFLGIIVIFVVIDFFQNFKFKKLLLRLSLLLSISFFVYFSIFLVHFKLLYKSGPGDAFMSQDFQVTLLENKANKTETGYLVWDKFIELNFAMYKYNKNITATHPFASKWYQWPVGEKPIWYWNESADNKTASVYLLGNLAVWWPALFAVIFSIFCLPIRNLRRKISPMIYILLCGYFANLLPYLGITRVTFLYHYFPSLLFGILIFALLYDRIFGPAFKKKEKYLYCAILILVFLFFVYLAPLSYGFFLPSNIFQLYHKFPIN
jgi:dolichyl-phosphate-mannose-protein mannosyltransferase